MVDNNRYIGVEQEFASFKRDNPQQQVRFQRYFDNLKKQEVHIEKGATAMRTDSGHAMYIDGDEVEICTPPIRLNKGFATRLTDLVMMAREKVAKAVPELYHTGYSMHWNVSRTHEANNRFLSGVAAPFNLFGLTPLSNGFNLRTKDEDDYNGSGNRAELLGDFITHEDQINALALMLGAYSYAFDQQESGKALVSICDSCHHFSVNNANKVVTPDGRFSEVNTYVAGSEEIPMSAQKNLELFYEWIRPFAEHIGTKEENDNLEDFVFARKKLEFDQFKYFTFIRERNGKDGGLYVPMNLEDLSMPDKKLKVATKDRAIPLEGRLLGEIITNPKHKIDGLYWGALLLKGKHRDKVIEIPGIGNIYKYAAYLNKSLPTLEQSPQLFIVPNEGKLRSMLNQDQSGPLKYDFDKDAFVWSTEAEKQIADFSRAPITKESAEILTNKILSGRGAMAIALSYLIGLGAGFPISHLIHNIHVNREANNIVQNVQSTNSLSNTNIQTIGGTHANNR